MMLYGVFVNIKLITSGTKQENLEFPLHKCGRQVIAYLKLFK